MNEFVDPGWLSLIPPLAAIGLALLTREVVLSLFAGVWLGALVLAGYDPFAGTAASLDFLVTALADESHVAIVIFSLLLGGMVGIMSRSGGTRGVVEVLGRLARTRTRGQFLTWASAAFIFFDDYANTLIRGNALRPMSDRLRISREKLAYLVDSTAAPLAVIAVVTTWIGFEISQIRDALAAEAERATDPERAAELQAGADAAFTVFLHSVPYLFYPVLALFFVLFVVVMRKDFGPMYQAERRSYTGGGLIRPGAVPAADPTAETMQAPDGIPHRWYNAAVPVVTVVAVALLGLWITGSEALEPAERTLWGVVGESDPFAALLWASFAGCAVAILMVTLQRILSLGQALQAWLGGIQSMLTAVVILVLAWALGEATGELGTGAYLASLLEGAIPLWLLPALVFVVASLTAFATGTSWGTMAILFPVVIPLAVALGAGVGFAGGEHYAILLGTVSSVMGGAVFGDHSSPISDTTVLSSMATACDLVDHVRTQLPYALVAALAGLILGELPVAAGLIHPVVGLALGLATIAAVIWFFGRDPAEGVPEVPLDEAEEPSQEELNPSVTAEVEAGAPGAAH